MTRPLRLGSLKGNITTRFIRHGGEADKGQLPWHTALMQASPAAERR